MACKKCIPFMMLRLTALMIRGGEKNTFLESLRDSLDPQTYEDKVLELGNEAFDDAIRIINEKCDKCLTIHH